MTDQPSTHSFSPRIGSPFDTTCLFLLDRTTHVQSGYMQELSSGKRGPTEHKSLHRTAGNLLGGGNFLFGVREHFHTFSFLPPAREIAVLSRPAALVQGTRALAAQPGECPGGHRGLLLPETPVLPPGPCHPTWALEEQALAVAQLHEQPKSSSTGSVKDYGFSRSRCQSICYLL